MAPVAPAAGLAFESQGPAAPGTFQWQPLFALAVAFTTFVLRHRHEFSGARVPQGSTSYGTDGLALMTVTSEISVDTGVAPDTRPPLQIFGEDESVFCYMTLVQRMPVIARDIIRDNAWLTEAQAAAVEEIAKELEDGGRGICRPVARLEADGNDPNQATAYERALIAPFREYIGKQWRETPWLHGEIFFYHRILEAIDWWSHQKDHFEVPKMKSLELAKESMLLLTNAIASSPCPEAEKDAALLKLIHSCLWGNKVDLCLFKVDDFSEEGVKEKDKGSNIMTDNAPEIVAHLKALQGKGQVDFILDNFGYELFTDLVLTYFILEYNYTENVVLHCKEYPYYVSDALEKDVVFLLDHLCELGDESAKTVGQRLKDLHAQGRLSWTSHPFWMAPSEFVDMPSDVRSTLAKSDLVFVKGDLNYRRLVGDRHWPYTTPFEQTVNYFPAPLCSLRTNKSEVLVGVTDESLKAVQSQDPEKWLVSGNFGVVSFWKP
uniref:Sugar phosphate phosphatase n=1 Tax=Eutreptiella gymnastica TaxID=73025 RepID=A0A7S1N9U1_9EUGL